MSNVDGEEDVYVVRQESIEEILERRKKEAIERGIVIEIVDDEEQEARIKQNKEEAIKRKLARLKSTTISSTTSIASVVTSAQKERIIKNHISSQESTSSEVEESSPYVGTQSLSQEQIARMKHQRELALSKKKRKFTSSSSSSVSSSPPSKSSSSSLISSPHSPQPSLSSIPATSVCSSSPQPTSSLSHSIVSTNPVTQPSKSVLSPFQKSVIAKKKSDALKKRRYSGSTSTESPQRLHISSQESTSSEVEESSPYVGTQSLSQDQIARMKLQRELALSKKKSKSTSQDSPLIRNSNDVQS